MDTTKWKRNKSVQVTASLKNVREQRLLDKELKHIDDLWHLELKAFTREKLEITREYTKLEDDRKNVEYLKDKFGDTTAAAAVTAAAITTDDEDDDNIDDEDKRRINKLKEYAENFRSLKKQQERENRNIEKFDFKLHERDKVKIKLQDIEKPTTILKEIGLSQSFPTIPNKPRLSRSNSTIGELIKAKSVSETNLASDFNIIQRDNKVKQQYLSLPDIRKNEFKKPRKFGPDRKTSIVTPALEEIPEFSTPKMTTRKRLLSLPHLGMMQKSHTVL